MKKSVVFGQTPQILKKCVSFDSNSTDFEIWVESGVISEDQNQKLWSNIIKDDQIWPHMIK